MSLTRDKHFSFMLNMIKEAQKIAENDGERYYTFFRSLIADAKKVSDEDIDKINSGELKYQLFENKKSASKKSSSTLQMFNVESVINELNSCTSREQGEAVLIKYCKPRAKAEYQSLLTYLNIAFKSNDTIPKLKDKIIEHTFSYRLGAEAIQNYGKR